MVAAVVAVAATHTVDAAVVALATVAEVVEILAKKVRVGLQGGKGGIKEKAKYFLLHTGAFLSLSV